MNYKVMGACVAVFLSAKAQGSDGISGDLVEEAVSSAFVTPRAENRTNPLLWGISPSPAKPISAAVSEVEKKPNPLSWSPSPGPVVNTVPTATEIEELLLWGINSTPAKSPDEKE